MAVANRRGRGYARSDREHFLLLRRVKRHKSGILRPWTDETHFAAEHVDQLKEFIDLGTPQNGSNSCDTWIAPTSDRGARDASHHRPEQEHRELLPSAADSLCPIDHPASAANRHSQGDLK